MKYVVSQIGVSPVGLHPIEIEAVSEAEAKENYETQRGLVKGVNALKVEILSGEIAEVATASPFGLPKADRYEPYVKPEPVIAKPVEAVKAFPDLVSKPVAAKVDSDGEEVLIVSN